MLSGGDARTPYGAASSAAAVAGLLSPFTLLIFFRKIWAESVIGLGETARKRNNNNSGLVSFVGSSGGGGGGGWGETRTTLTVAEGRQEGRQAGKAGKQGEQARRWVR